MISSVWICLFLFTWIAVSSALPGPNLMSVSEIQATGKILFRELRDSECKVKCKSRKSRIMCGSDGVSYQSKCELKRARRCEGKHITIRKKGKCSEQDVPLTKCVQQKEEALATVNRSEANRIFIPECNADGTFAEVQCHKPSNYCWCVSPNDGKPLSGSSTKNGKPKCKEKSKNSKPKGSRRSSKGRPKRCTVQEKRRFDSNLVRVFTEEYNRSMKISQHLKTTTSGPYDTLERRVVDWKFAQYDTNSDNLLQIKEVNALRRLVKKFIKPRSCAKRFLKFCDPDKSKDIERQEWSTCLGVELNTDDLTKTTKKPDEKTTGESLDLNKLLNNNRPPAPKPTKGNIGMIERPGFSSFPINTESSLSGLIKPRPDRKPNTDKQPHDCRKDRTSALENEAETPNAGIFIPTCTADGQWTPAQCHKSTGYCWCVDQTSGTPITGTSTKGVKPKCDFANEREIAGCKYSEKQSFLTDLLNVLKLEMEEYALNNSTDHSALDVNPEHSLPERAVRWRFNNLDTNKNKILDNGEVEAFRTSSLKQAQRKETRKCARKFVRYCDEDNNKTITEQEWIDCLGVKKNASMSLPSNPKRIGKNPFDEYLHDADR